MPLSSTINVNGLFECDNKKYYLNPLVGVLVYIPPNNLC